MASTPTKLRVFDITLTVAGAATTQDIAAWTSPNQKTKVTLPNDLSSSAFADVFEEMTTKIVRAIRLNSTTISMLVDDKEHIVRDKSFPLPSQTNHHLEAVDEALVALRKALGEK